MVDWFHKSWVSMELNTLRSFLRQVDAVASEEMERKAQAVEAQENEEEGDMENALMEPFGWLELAAKTVYYELASLVENEIQTAAHPAWAAKRLPDQPAIWFDKDDEYTKEFRKWWARKVSHENFGKLVPLIESHYGFKVWTLPGSATVLRVRDVVNDLKHRKGRLDSRRPGYSFRDALRKHELDRDDAEKAISETRVFLEALWANTNSE